MQIKQLRIRRFRGILRLEWDIPEAFVCLIGSNDATKTTILDALEYVLSPRWNIPFTDSDFYCGITKRPLEIIATVGDLPTELLSEDKFGLHLRGWHSERGLLDEPPNQQTGTTNNCEPIITIRLQVDQSLEPKWAVITDRNPEGIRISSADREKLGMSRLGSYVDRDLTWGRGSSLSRFTDTTESIASILADANRTAREAISKAPLTQLDEAAEQAQDAAKLLGVSPNDKYKPALDLISNSLNIGGLSLHDGDIPARLLGLGSRRLLTLALQMKATQAGAILLIDEIEHGLEPYRLRRLLRQLNPLNGTSVDLGHQQAIVTSHSPISISELKASNLAIVHSNNGKTEVIEIPDVLEKTLSFAPEALLGRKIIVCEGETELGICRALDKKWTSEHNQISFAYLGLVPIVYGQGGGTDMTIRLAQSLAELGYDVSVLLDSDNRLPSGQEKSDLEALGICVVQWSGNCNTEDRVALDLPWQGVKKLVQLAETLGTPHQGILQRIGTQLDAQLTAGQDDDPDDWLANHDEQTVREAIGKVAGSGRKSWFKDTAKGEELGKLICEYLPDIPHTDLAQKLKNLEEWAYRD